jgi:hypothetical protein
MVAAAVLTIPAVPAAQSADSTGVLAGAGIQILDGMSFSGPVGPKGKPTRRDDLFLFSDGSFISKNCQELGFTAAPYWVRRSGNIVHFRVELESPEHGTIVYTGQVQGNELEASFAWIKDRWYWTIEREFWFKGTRVGAD